MEDLKTPDSEKAQARFIFLVNAQTSLGGYLVTNGASPELATTQVNELINEVCDDPSVILKSWFGSNNQPLVDFINLSSLPFMTAGAKAHITNFLIPPE